MVRSLFCFASLFLFLVPLAGQVRLKPEGRLNLTYGLFRVPDADPNLVPLLTADLGLSAVSPEVRSELQVRFLASEPTQVNLLRAWVRARLGEEARFTAGWARVSWGQGIFFNSGDVVYGSNFLNRDLSATEIRDEASLVLAYYQDFGELSFFEVVALPPALVWKAGKLSAGEWDSAATGGRLVVTLPEDWTGLRWETGYLFRGEISQPQALVERGHNLYLALQGSLWGLANLYGSARLVLDPRDLSWDKTKNTLSLSGGVFRIWNMDEGASFSFRLEGLLETIIHPPLLSGYLELNFTPDGKGSFLGRALFHSDTSANLLLGWVQKMYQGLSAQLLVQAQLGEPSDVFGFNRPNDMGVLLVIEYLLR